MGARFLLGSRWTGCWLRGNWAASRVAVVVWSASALLSVAPAWGQASDLQSAQAPTVPTGQTSAEHGRALLDQMVQALGGHVWLDRSTMTMLGRTAQFFRSQPTGVVVEYQAFRQLPTATRPELERIEFITDKSMILPGKKRDVVQVWTADNGYELTYKGTTTLPKEQVQDYLRRRRHSIEDVVERWLKAPGVDVVSEGTTMVNRHLADRVTVLSANNDAVTIDLDQTTHLPLSRTFEWRNEQFKDHDEDREDYDDWHTLDGIPTALTLTRYRNGDMISQRFLTKVEYNKPLAADMFDPGAGLKRK